MTGRTMTINDWGNVFIKVNPFLFIFSLFYCNSFGREWITPKANENYDNDKCSH